MEVPCRASVEAEEALPFQASVEAEEALPSRASEEEAEEGDHPCQASEEEAVEERLLTDQVASHRAEAAGCSVRLLSRSCQATVAQFQGGAAFASFVPKLPPTLPSGTTFHPTSFGVLARHAFLTVLGL